MGSVAHEIKVVYVTTIDMTVRFLLLDALLYLKNGGYDVSVVCSAGPWISDIELAGIPVRIVALTRRITPVRDLLAFWELHSYFRKQDFTIVHTHTPKANLVGRLAARLAGVPIVVGTEHGFYFRYKTGWSRWLHATAARLGACASDVTFVINHEDWELAQRERIVHPTKLVLIAGGTGVNLDRFNPLAVDPLAVRRCLGIKPAVPVVGFVGRLTPEKGCREFIQAAAQIASTIPQIRFLVVGPSDGISQRELEAMAAELCVSDKVLFLGIRTDMPELYAAMDIVTLPSYREGLGVTLMEAAAMGKPTVATDICGCREVVSHGETGLLVPPRDADALARAILELLQDEEKRRTMGEAGRRRAEALFDGRKVFEKVEWTYQRLLRQKGYDPA